MDYLRIAYELLTSDKEDYYRNKQEITTLKAKYYNFRNDSRFQQNVLNDSPECTLSDYTSTDTKSPEFALIYKNFWANNNFPSVDYRIQPNRKVLDFLLEYNEKFIKKSIPLEGFQLRGLSTNGLSDEQYEKLGLKERSNESSIRNISENDVLGFINKELEVIVKKKFSFIGWLTDSDRYDVYDNEKYSNTYGKRISINYVKKDNQQPRTYPLKEPGLLPSVNIVKGNINNYTLAHELTHCVHYGFVPYYKVPRNTVEIPAMALEELLKFRTSYYDSKYYTHLATNKTITKFDLSLRMQTAIAIADLEKTSPIDFNNRIERHGNFSGLYDVASRFWHYETYHRQYYSYALGYVLAQILYTKEKHVLHNLVRTNYNIDNFIDVTSRILYNEQPSGTINN